VERREHERQRGLGDARVGREVVDERAEALARGELPPRGTPVSLGPRYPPTGREWDTPSCR
jgi:hypothetical protein